MGEPVEVRPLTTLDDARAAAALFDRIWDERRVMGAPQLRAMAAHGGQVLGAFAGREMVGALVGLVGLTEDGRSTLHSHITGVAPDQQHRGVGFLLKQAQRAWCLSRGIDVVTWTMDPLVARNARFNLHKLGAVSDRFHREYYGPMDDAFNRGDRSDRLEIRWDLRSDRVRQALEGNPQEPSEGDALLDERDGRPDPRPFPDTSPVLVRIPLDYHALRTSDPRTAGLWRDAVATALEDAFGRRLVGTGFLRDGAYVFERP